MSIMQALLLGIIQGITEFLPISSSGHLVFVPALFGWEDQGLAFDVFVHLGSLVAVIVYFRQMLWKLTKALVCRVDKKDTRLAWMLVLSIIPAGLVGLFLGDWIEGNLRSPAVIATSLIGWGAVLFLADRYGQRQKNASSRIEETTVKQALCISFAQAIALIPGTSRSGITMTAGLFSKLDKKTAAAFSFLMSVPVILVAGLVKVKELVSQTTISIDWFSYGIGFIAAALSGFFAIALLMKVIEKWSFTPFVIYRIVIGIGILIWLV